jgi:hypothetical protein
MLRTILSAVCRAVAWAANKCVALAQHADLLFPGVEQVEVLRCSIVGKTPKGEEVGA